MNLTHSWRVIRDALKADKERQQARVAMRETQFLPAALEVIEQPVSPTSRATAWVLMIGLLATVAWLILGKVDVVATAPGKILPSGSVKIVQSAGSGVVTATARSRTSGSAGFCTTSLCGAGIAGSGLGVVGPLAAATMTGVGTGCGGGTANVGVFDRSTAITSGAGMGVGAMSTGASARNGALAGTSLGATTGSALAGTVVLASTSALNAFVSSVRLGGGAVVAGSNSLGSLAAA